MLKDIQVVMLPTEKAWDNGIGLHYSHNSRMMQMKRELNGNKIFDVGVSSTSSEYLPQHLYFLSDEEIGIELQLIKLEGEQDGWYIHSTFGYHKIIATTDRSLIIDVINPLGETCKGGILPTCSQSFIQKYIERYNAGKPIEKVVVEYEYTGRQVTIHEGSSTSFKQIKDEYVPKLRDNEIIIHSVKDIFTREEVISVLDKRQEEIHKGKGIRMTISDKTPIDFIETAEQWFNSKY